MSLIPNKSTRTLILVMIVLVFTGIVISKIYYESINRSVDPRVRLARQMYARYNDYTQSADSHAILALLDSIEMIYSSINHYRTSFEIGVLNNNKTALFLAAALNRKDPKDMTTDAFRSLNTDSLFALAEETVMTSIGLYTEWLARFKDRNEEEIIQEIESDFLDGLEEFAVKEQEIFLKKRVEESMVAQYETRRRLSVSYTNLGIIYRHREEFAKAAEYNQKALTLWEDNLTARNNLNILLGRPIEKRNFLQKLLPPDKDD